MWNRSDICTIRCNGMTMIKNYLHVIFINHLILLIVFPLSLYCQSLATWENTNVPASAPVTTLAIRDSFFVAGTNGEGVFISTDNGSTWRDANNGLQSKIIHTIYIDGTTIFAGTETGASRSTDYGSTWKTVNTGLAGKGVWSFAARHISHDDSTVYTGTWSGVYMSTDNGTTWDTTELSSSPAPVHSLVVFDNFVYAATVAGGTFVSSDGGMTWRDISLIVDYGSGNKVLVPVYSLARYDTLIVASAGMGYFYFTRYDDPQFIKSFGALQHIYGYPFLNFAVRNDTLFAGSSYGTIICAVFNGMLWKFKSIAFVGTVHALAVNDSYLIVGTDTGVWRLWYPGSVTPVQTAKEEMVGFELSQNYPNPFNASTRIKFSIPNPTRVSLRVYTILGKQADEIIDKEMNSGTYEIDYWPALLPSGVYFYSLTTNTFKITKKLILMK